MTPLRVPVLLLRDDAAAPGYATDGSVGMDLCARLDEPLRLAPGGRALAPTGIAVALPPGYKAQVRPRSGLALKRGLTVLNSPGTVDSDYRGEIGVILINLGQQSVTVAPGDRVAQLVVAPVSRVAWEIAETLDETARSVGGFGSTGTD